MLRTVVVFPVAALFLTVSSRAATLPYFEGFNDDPIGTLAPSEPAPELGSFVESTDSQWTVISGGISGNSYRNTYSADNTPSSTGINFANVLGGPAATAQSFTFSTDFQFNGITSGNTTVGLGFLGASNAFNPGYFVDLNFGVSTGSPAAGQLRFVEDGSIIAGGITTGTPALGVTYKLTLSGLYVDSNGDLSNDRLDLSASISGGSGTSALTGTITFNDNTPQTGSFFGYRTRNNVADLDVQFDNFALAVPEPASAALAVFGGISLLIRRRPRSL